MHATSSRPPRPSRRAAPPKNQPPGRSDSVRLNAAQTEAVNHDVGPLLVLAGAGTGKTRVIVERIAHLIEGGVEPQAILAVTFTNKAAREMGERLATRVGNPRANKVVLGTFHRFGLDFLQVESESLGFASKFVIFDQSDALALIKDLLRRDRRASGRRKLDPAAIQSRISLWKNAYVSPASAIAADKTFESHEVAADLYEHYETGLRAQAAFDFDDLVVVPARALRDREDVRDRWQRKFRYILVDEFQDTSASQLELVRHLTNRFGNICVVGDDDQSIYAWRGADISNIRDFPKTFPGTKVVKLEENYRSQAPILAVANAAIAQSTQRPFTKTLRAFRTKTEPVRLITVEDAGAESKFVAAEIRRLRDEEKVPLKHICVLYRSNQTARLLEEELRSASVSYRLFGGTQVFDRKEVKDAVAYMRVVLNPRDEISLRRILNYPTRGIGDASVERIERHAKATKKTFVEACADVERLDDVPDAAKTGIKQLFETLGVARASVRAGAGLANPGRALLERVGLRRAIESDREDGDAEAAVATRRLGNVEFILGAIGRFEAKHPHQERDLLSFLGRLATREEESEESEDPGNVVTLSTLHAAKGLEFAQVFLVGCTEGQLPHSRTTDPKASEAIAGDVEEERRLFYVGVTRAKDRLYLVKAKRRMLRGRVVPLTPSRFLDGLPSELIIESSPVISSAMDIEDIGSMARALLDSL